MSERFITQPCRGLDIRDWQRNETGADTVSGELRKEDVAHVAIMASSRIGVHDTPRFRGGGRERKTEMSPFAGRILAAQDAGLEPTSLPGGDRDAVTSCHQRMGPAGVATLSGERVQRRQPVENGPGG